MSKLAITSYDVVVVGSGPAGSTTAFLLAQAGLKVAVIEKAALPRYKTCGGGIVRRAVRLLEIDMQQVVDQECHRAELNFFETGLHFSTKRAEPIICMTMRDKFDFLLVSAAKDSGVDVFERCEVVDLMSSTDGIRLMTRTQTFSSRFVIAADGAIGTIARKAGWHDTRSLAPAVECEVSVPGEVLENFKDVARFDFGVIPCGYAWVFPKKTHLSIGAVSMKGKATNLKRAVWQYMKLIGINEILKIEQHGFLIPVRPMKDTFVKNHTLLVGDAAGFADPLTGEGITFAVQSARIAAQAFIKAGFHEPDVRQAYHSELCKTILPELRVGKWLARLLYDCPTVQAWLFRRHGQKFSEAMTDVMLGTKTYRCALSNPLSYLSLVRQMYKDRPANITSGVC